jgi:aminopeptidase N
MYGYSVRTRLRCAVAAFAASTLALCLGVVPPPALGSSAREPEPGGSGIGDSYFPLYGNSGYAVRNYRLAVRYDPDTDRISARAIIVSHAQQALSSFNLDLAGLRVHRVAVDGTPATWTRRADHELVITPSRPVARNALFRTFVRYSGIPRVVNSPTLGQFGFLTTPDGALAVGEPEIAAFWYPVNDHPRDKARYRVSLTVPRGLQAISNGLPTERRFRGEWVTTSWTTRDPMASYLVFAAIGRFDVHRWRTASGLPVIDAVDSGITGPLRRRIDASLARQGQMLRHLTRWFGPYPFEAVGGVVDDLEIGFALENQTRPVYSPGFWDIPQVPTLGDDVVVHELAHQWYGDSVAVDRWRDIWLNEGFATYAEWLWQGVEHGFTPAEVFRANYAEIPADDEFWDLRIGDPGPQALFDFPVYLRGAMTLQALRAAIGSGEFFQVMRTWALTRRNGNGSTPDFIRLAERISGQELSPLFRAWLFTSGKPALTRTSAQLHDSAASADPRLRRLIDRWRSGVDLRLQLQSSSR